MRLGEKSFKSGPIIDVESGQTARNLQRFVG
jgi:hypothetical protein